MEKNEEEPSSSTTIQQTTINDDEKMDENDNRYFEKDPVGWLEKYFEREGLSINFEYKSEGKGSDIVCSIE